VTAAAALTQVCAHAVFPTLSGDIKKIKNDANLIFYMLCSEKIGFLEDGIFGN
jgi:hypothetical protein